MGPGFVVEGNVSANDPDRDIDGRLPLIPIRQTSTGSQVSMTGPQHSGKSFLPKKGKEKKGPGNLIFWRSTRPFPAPKATFSDGFLSGDGPFKPPKLTVSGSGGRYVYRSPRVLLTVGPGLLKNFTVDTWRPISPSLSAPSGKGFSEYCSLNRLSKCPILAPEAVESRLGKLCDRSNHGGVVSGPAMPTSTPEIDNLTCIDTRYSAFSL